MRLADSTLVFLFSVARKGMQSKVDLYNRKKKQNKQHMRTLLRLIKIKLKNCITPKITIRQVAVASFLIWLKNDTIYMYPKISSAITFIIILILRTKLLILDSFCSCVYLRFFSFPKFSTIYVIYILLNNHLILNDLGLCFSKETNCVYGSMCMSMYKSDKKLVHRKQNTNNKSKK